MTRLLQSLSTLRRLGHPSATQDSLLAADHALPGGIGYPQGYSKRFQKFYISSSFSRLILALRKHHNTTKQMRLSTSEFIRRFLLHVLPKRFVRIRSYGILCNRNKKELIHKCRTLIPARILTDKSPIEDGETAGHESDPDSSEKNYRLCPECRTGHMVDIRTIEPQRSSNNSSFFDTSWTEHQRLVEKLPGHPSSHHYHTARPCPVAAHFTRGMRKYTVVFHRSAAGDFCRPPHSPQLRSPPRSNTSRI